MTDDTLAHFRQSIDNIDTALVCLLAERFKVTQAVGRYKAATGLPPADPGREEAQIARLRTLAAAADLDPDFGEKFLRFIIDEVIRHHERARDGDRGGMNTAIEAAADIATGAVLARAVEPGAGEPGGHAGGACLNCGTALHGEFCHACGQAGHIHRTLGSIGHDLLHGVFHFEGKIWRTLPMLVLHPGDLTRRYIAGERARFVSPMALFLFTVFLMFAVFGAIGGDLAKVGGNVDQAAVKIGESRDQLAAELRRLERQRAEAVKAGNPVAAIDRRIAERRDDVATIGRLQQEIGGTGKTFRAHSRWRWLDEGIQHARGNPGLALYKFQSSAYKYSWALILLSTPFVALLFLWRRQFALYDHAIFVTYSIAFMTLLAILLELLVAVGAPSGLVAVLILVVPPAHMAAQLRGAYRLGRFSTAWRTAALMVFSFAALLLFAIGLLAIGVLH